MAATPFRPLSASFFSFLQQTALPRDRRRTSNAFRLATSHFLQPLLEGRMSSWSAVCFGRENNASCFCARGLGDSRPSCGGEPTGRRGRSAWQMCSHDLADKITRVLEVCVESVRSALNAYEGGARRLELCSSLCLGGLTPSVGLLRAVRKQVPADCDVFVMIRPNQRESFVYESDEVEAMVEDVKVLKENGADGFVFGCLDERRRIDEGVCKKLLEAAGGRPSTFHRAFDGVVDPVASLRTLIRLGFSRVLTSGQEKSAFQGRHLIQRLVSTASECGSELIIVAGGGICPGNLREILETSRVREYHGSARADWTSAPTQLEVYLADPSVVKQLVEIGESFWRGER